MFIMFISIYVRKIIFCVPFKVCMWFDTMYECPILYDYQMPKTKQHVLDMQPPWIYFPTSIPIKFQVSTTSMCMQTLCLCAYYFLCVQFICLYVTFVQNLVYGEMILNLLWYRDKWWTTTTSIDCSSCSSYKSKSNVCSANIGSKNWQL